MKLPDYEDINFKIETYNKAVEIFKPFSEKNNLRFFRSLNVSNVSDNEYVDLSYNDIKYDNPYSYYIYFTKNTCFIFSIRDIYNFIAYDIKTNPYTKVLLSVLQRKNMIKNIFQYFVILKQLCETLNIWIDPLSNNNDILKCISGGRSNIEKTVFIDMFSVVEKCYLTN